MNNVFVSWLRDDLEIYSSRREQELSKNGFRSYSWHMKSFDSYIAQFPIRNMVDESLIAGWIKTLSHLVDGTINNYISDIRQFLLFENKHKGSHHFIPEFRNEVDLYVPHYFEDTERDKLYAIADNYPSRWNNHLPWIKVELPMIMRIMDASGTRISEILCLQRRDVDLNRNVITILNAKNEKQRYLPVSKSLGDVLLKYCKAMQIMETPDALLFPARSRHEHLNPHDVYSRFIHVMRYAGIDRGTETHTRKACLYNFRHTFAIRSFRQLEQNGIHLDDVIPYLSIYMGHVGLKETEKYLKFSADTFPEEIDKFDHFTESVMPKEDLWERWAL